MCSFALYRLPGQNHYYKVEQTSGCPRVLSSLAELTPDMSGFLIVPFAPSTEMPIVLLTASPDAPFPIPVQEKDEGFHADGKAFQVPSSCEDEGHTAYSRTFRLFHDQLISGRFQKIVLARQRLLSAECRVQSAESGLTPSSPSAPANFALCTLHSAFLKACRAYPRAMVMLFSTPHTGTWLMATPEVLLEKNGDDWHSVALAGTMQLADHQLQMDDPPGSRIDNNKVCWNEKNITEQRVVASYIYNTLRPFATDIREEGPRTVRAGRLVHLRSDFFFAMRSGVSPTALLEQLHPTPAVCGLPKSDTFRFIMKHEPQPRRYYSGFAGPWNLPVAHGQPLHQTHLYVSLRCVEFSSEGLFRLYAGGGLLPDSEEQQEWEETEAKMRTIAKTL